MVGSRKRNLASRGSREEEVNMTDFSDNPETRIPAFNHKGDITLFSWIELVDKILHVRAQTWSDNRDFAVAASMGYDIKTQFILVVFAAWNKKDIKERPEECEFFTCNDLISKKDVVVDAAAAVEGKWKSGIQFVEQWIVPTRAKHVLTPASEVEKKYNLPEGYLAPPAGPMIPSKESLEQLHSIMEQSVTLTANPCPDCKGTRVYQGLTGTEPCKRCSS